VIWTVLGTIGLVAITIAGGTSSLYVQRLVE
jgi:hypothetical protein